MNITFINFNGQIFESERARKFLFADRKTKLTFDADLFLNRF